MKTAFILGAGASREAGLPMSGELVDKVLEYADRCKGEWQPINDAIRWAHRQMVRHVDHPWDANIELLFNILEMASAQPHLPEAAVFRQVHRPARRAWRGYERLMSLPDPNPYKVNTADNVFAEACNQFRFGLAGFLTLKEPSKAIYVVPLLEYCQRTGSSIISLNYDNVVESASDLCGIAVDDGLGQWTSKRQLSFSSDSVRLVKLHGSLNWYEKDERLDGGSKRRPTIVRGEFTGHPLTPRVLIFGGTNKMTFRAPFPDLYAESRRIVLDADVVCVVGYSGMDPHVNQILQDWAFSADYKLYAEATFYGEVYSRIFDVGPFHDLDTPKESRRRPRQVTKMNRSLKFKKLEWPKSKSPHTASFFAEIASILNQQMHQGAAQ